MLRLTPTVVITAAEKSAEIGHRTSSGTQHADVVTNTIGANVYNDFHIVSLCSALDMKVDESEKSGALSGSASKHFVPTHVILTVASTGGALNADSTVNIGTTAGGTEIFSGIATTGLTAVGACRVFQNTAQTHTVLGNGLIYANVETAETGAGTLTLDIRVVGYQV
jgi:hypothetical protein